MIGALLLTLGAVAPVQDAAPRELGREEARVALDSALSWILENQNEDGSWGLPMPCHGEDDGFAYFAYHGYREGAHGVVLRALLIAPETPERRAALERGLRWTLTKEITPRGDDWDVDGTWGVVYSFDAITHAALDPRFAGEEWQGAFRTRAEALLVELKRRQTLEGGWAYYDDPPFTEKPTWATSFTTALLLPALRHAKEDLGWPVPEGMLERAVTAVRRCALPNGAYSYDISARPEGYDLEDINQPAGSLCRIQVCNWALAKCGVGWVTPDKMSEGLDWLFRLHTWLDMARLEPIPHHKYYANSGYFYFFGHAYAAEVIELLPASEREGWHRKLRAEVIKLQAEDGSTSDFLSGHYLEASSTGFLAWILARGLQEESGT